MNLPINDILSEAAVRLGLKDTRIGTLQKRQDELAESIRRNNNKLNEQKKKVALIDGQLSEKKKEYDAAGPGIKAIVKRELVLLLKQLDRIAEPVDAIADALERDQMIKDKIDMLILAETNPPDAEGIEDIMIDLKTWLKSNEGVAIAAETLAGTKYTSPESATDDERISAIGKTPESAVPPVKDEYDERISQIV